MAEKTITISSISCGHCSNTIKRELEEMAGVQAVDADPGTKKVTIKWQSPATWTTITELLNEINYPADA